MGSAASSQPIVVVAAAATNETRKKRRNLFVASLTGRGRSKKHQKGDSAMAASTLLIQCILAHKYEEAAVMLSRGNVKELASTPVLVRVGNAAVAVHVLPLHVACAQLNAPQQFCQMLMDAYPEALVIPTTEGTAAAAVTTEGPHSSNRSGSHRSLRRKTLDLVTSATTVGMTSDRSKQRSLYAATNNSNHSMRSLGSHLSASVDTTETTSSTALSPPDMAVGWLPLHVAVAYNAHSIELMEMLLSKDTRALYFKTAQGCLPLHLVCGTSAFTTTSRQEPPPKQVCSQLLAAFPESRFIPNLDGKLPLQLWKETHGEDKMDMPRGLVGRVRNGGADDGLVQRRSSHRRFIHNMPSISGSNNNSSSSSSRSSSSRSSKTENKKGKTKGDASTSPIHPSSFLKPTPLYQAILVQDWDRVLELLRQQPRSAQVWTCNSQLPPCCHALPLHLAVQEKAPPNILKALVLLYPKAVAAVEYMGRNVLHTACRMEDYDDEDGDFAILEALLTSAPRSALKTAASTPDATGLLPLHYLAENESECTSNTTIQRLLNAYPQAVVTKGGVRNATPVDILKQSGSSCQQQTLLQLLDRGTPYWLAPTPPRGGSLDFLMSRHNQSSLDYSYVLDRLSEEDAEEEVSAWYRVLTSGGKTKRMNLLHYICIHHHNHTADEWRDVLNKILQVHPKALSTPCFDEYDMLPLHLAIQYGAAPSFMEFLLNAYPKAARQPDAMGLLPIHLACSCDGAPNPSWIQTLVDAHPASLKVRDRKGFTPNVYAEANAFHPNAKRIVELVSPMSA